MKKEWTVDSSDIEDIIASLEEVGMEVSPGSSNEYVLIEDLNGTHFNLPRDFNIFTNPTNNLLPEQTKYEKTDRVNDCEQPLRFQNVLDDLTYKTSCIMDVNGIAA